MGTDRTHPGEPKCRSEAQNCSAETICGVLVTKDAAARNYYLSALPPFQHPYVYQGNKGE